MKKMYVSAILILLFCSILTAQDFDADGNMKILPYEPTQAREIELLTQDIRDYHRRIEGLLPFLNRRKKIINNEYFQFVPAMENFNFPVRDRYLIDRKFYLKTAGGNKELKLEGIRFITRKSLVTKLRPFSEEVGELKNESVAASDPNSLVLTVQRKTDAGVQEEVYNLAIMRFPNQRVKLVRTYRDSLMEVVRSIEKYVQGTLQADKRDVDTMLDGIESGGTFQEYNSRK
ncbi:hypothetical protein CH373_03395 [Leptospira perolatii]|uniref:Toluene tolerance protein n=1 Tax=Leptospira perolatii TaxID=2023191 RepID=A0A2M9ZST5_9LEPT|nr:hypothetical protein [Leptospira perolatii]PJZ68089.1 hypothetical protein CH360_18025 [Leptospira perolatii]PJZ75075.1 hypothetical protein CH373_03395 [Leptospira perolatii]